MSNEFDFYDESALVARLTRAIEKRPQEVVFLVGSPLSAANHVGGRGVPTVDGIVQMIRQEFEDDESELTSFDEDVARAGERRYQTAFRFLQGNRGQPVANEIIRRAVLHSRLHDEQYSSIEEPACRIWESEIAGWWLSPATEALGELVTKVPKIFGHAILTTNFDPLIEVAIRKAHGQLFRTVLHADGDVHQTEGDGCHVIHLHGYWYSSDTLNTTRQLTQERPRLKASLTSLLKDRLVVVCGYGGWDDVFTSTLLDLVRDDSAGPEILWTFHSPNPMVVPTLADQLAPGIARGRVLLYSGVDCNSLFPRVLDAWRSSAPYFSATEVSRSNPVIISPRFQAIQSETAEINRVLEGDDEDRPPLVDLCLGREGELDIIEQSPARVLFITGIGGQGKSTLAASYFSRMQGSKKFNYFIWRDCKEEAERFENQLASIIETLSGGALSGTLLAKQPIELLIEILTDRLEQLCALFVFDNVDHYVNLETGTLTSSADLFLRAFLKVKTDSRLVFTCRPEIRSAEKGTLSMRLEGVSAETALELFAKRKADSPESDIRKAHELTNGHVFWLDLLALQVAQKHAGRPLDQLLTEAWTGDGDAPTITLRSIWSNLNEKERAVLRFMAETVRPESESELAEYLRNEMNYNRLTRAIRSLRRQNLIVIKKASEGQEFLELHPIVRQFVRTSFSRNERSKTIGIIFGVYEQFMKRYRDQLSSRPTFTMLQHWTQATELAVEAGRTDAAITTLADSSSAFGASAFPREYTRAMRLVLESFDWVSNCSKYKHFDLAFRVYIRTLSYLGEYTEADQQLDRFEKTVPERDARFIFYCDLRCYHEWLKGNFENAVAWGRQGLEILQATGADIDVGIEHSLALAERDAGRPEVALPMFLAGKTLVSVVDPDELDEDSSGAYYGNIGRCLQFMGRIDQALVCYQKSALLVERRRGNEHVINQGFIRLWVGEVLLAKSQTRLAYVFFEAARRKWEDVSPPKMKQVEDLQQQLGPGALDQRSIKEHVERTCREWIFGEYLDAS